MIDIIQRYLGKHDLKTDAFDCRSAVIADVFCYSDELAIVGSLGLAALVSLYL